MLIMRTCQLPWQSFGYLSLEWMGRQVGMHHADALICKWIPGLFIRLRLHELTLISVSGQCIEDRLFSSWSKFPMRKSRNTKAHRAEGDIGRSN